MMQPGLERGAQDGHIDHAALMSPRRMDQGQRHSSGIRTRRKECRLEETSKPRPDASERRGFDGASWHFCSLSTRQVGFELLTPSC